MRKYRGLITVFLSVVAFLLTALTIVTFVMKNTLFKVDFYQKTVVTDEYLDTLYSTIDKDVSQAIMVLEVDSDSIMNTVDKEQLKELSDSVIKNIANYLIYKVNVPTVQYSNESMKDVIRTDLEEYAKNHDLTLDITDEVINDIYISLTETVTKNINFISPSMLKMVPALHKFEMFSQLLSIFLLLDIAMIAGIILLYRKRLYRGFYYAFTSVWLASAVFFIPAVWLSFKDIPAGIALSASPLKSFVTSILYEIIDISIKASGIVFAAASVIITVSAVVLIGRHIKRYSRRHNYSHKMN